MWGFIDCCQLIYFPLYVAKLLNNILIFSHGIKAKFGSLGYFLFNLHCWIFFPSVCCSAQSSSFFYPKQSTLKPYYTYLFQPSLPIAKVFFSPKTLLFALFCLAFITQNFLSLFPHNIIRSDAIEVSNTPKIQVTETPSTVLARDLQNIQPSYWLNGKNYLKWSQFVSIFLKRRTN